MSTRSSFEGFNDEEKIPTDSRRNSLLPTVGDESYSQRDENSLHIVCASKCLTNNALKKSVKNDVTKDDKHTPSIDATAFDPLVIHCYHYLVVTLRTRKETGSPFVLFMNPKARLTKLLRTVRKISSYGDILTIPIKMFHLKI